MTALDLGPDRLFVARDGVIRALGSQTVLGDVLEANLLRDEIDAGRGRLLLAWSGTLADDLFEPHPMNWLTPGAETLDAACERLRPTLEASGTTLCLQPHARHVLSDVPSCRAFLDRHDGGPFAIALAPASMLEPGMLADLDDHLRRFVESLADRCAMVRLADVALDDDGTSCRTVPLGRGVLPRTRLLELLGQHLPADIPIVLDAKDLDEQIAWLDDASGLSCRSRSC